MKSNKINKGKQKIMDAAIEVIKEKGVEDATVREIATKAGLTTGAIYHHYKNKDELLFDVINHSIHFSYKFVEMLEKEPKKNDTLLSKLHKEATIRLSKPDEQKLHILLLGDAISKDGIMKEKYQTNYKNVINNVADLYFVAYGIENEKLKKSVASILTAALDGVAIQSSLGVLPDSQEVYIKAFIDFFTESIPIFLEKYLENDDNK